MSNNKNAYEIRLEILKMAHDDAHGKYHQKIDILRQEADRTNTSFDSNLTETLFPTSAEILAKAEELYSFVEGKH